MEKSKFIYCGPDFLLVQMVSLQAPDCLKNAIFLEFIRPFTLYPHLMFD
jgi:hypothetical protein